MRWSQVLNVVDVHCGGENARVVTGGVGDVPGETMLDKRAYLTEQRDDLRLRLLQEPRGGVIHSADFVLPSRHPEAQLGYVIAESTEYPVMSGSNTICVTTALLETGMLPMIEPVTHLTLESAAGLIRVECTCADGKVTSVRFTNQPAFVYHLDAAGRGARPRHGDGRRRLGRDGVRARSTRPRSASSSPPTRAATSAWWARRSSSPPPTSCPPCTPSTPSSRGSRTSSSPGRSAVRPRASSPRATRSWSAPAGSTARPAAPARRRGWPCCTPAASSRPGENFVHTSIIGSRFDSRIESLTTVGGVPAVVPSVAGQAWITQLCQVGVDPSDPFPSGYTLADTWGAAPPSPLAARLTAAAAEVGA